MGGVIVLCSIVLLVFVGVDLLVYMQARCFGCFGGPSSEVCAYSVCSFFIVAGLCGFQCWFIR